MDAELSNLQLLNTPGGSLGRFLSTQARQKEHWKGSYFGSVASTMSLEKRSIFTE